MKTYKRFFVLAILTSILTGSTFAGDEVATKTIEKEYTADESTHLMIQNKFGSVDIKDWDKDEIHFIVTITVEHPRQEKAEEILNYINVIFSEKENKIRAVTEFDDEIKDKVFKGKDKNFSIDYSVQVPKYIKLSLDNKYGDIFINELQGQVDIQLKYGSIKINALQRGNEKPMNKIELAYSKGVIEESNWLKVNMKYSDLRIPSNKAIIILSKYSKVSINQSSSIVMEGKYDTYRIGDLTNFVCFTSYSNFKINSIQKKIIIDSKYTDFKIETVPSNFKNIEINNKYGKISIGIDENASYKLNGEAKYGKIYYPETGNVSRVQQTTSFTVFGLVGTNKQTNSVVKINSSYGNITLIE